MSRGYRRKSAEQDMHLEEAMTNQEKLDIKCRLEIAKTLRPKFAKCVNAFEAELCEGICKTLVERGLYKKMDRLEGNVPRRCMMKVRRMIEITRQSYENHVMQGLLGFVVNNEPIVLPDPELDGFYDVVTQIVENERLNVKL